MAAAPAFRLLRFALPVAVAIAVLAAAPTQSRASEPVTATVAGSVKKPPSAKRPSTLAARRPAKRPVKTRPPRAAAAPATPNDPLWSSSWSLAKTHATAAWKLTAGGPETVVAVLDTGVDLAHPDLQGSFVQGHDFVNGDGDPSDDHGHGTMVAGVVAARANNGLGGLGTCSGCALMPVKVIAANGSGSAPDIAAGIRWAADNGADVVNMSFTLSGPDDGIRDAIEHAQRLGVLVVAAAGNAGTADITFPAGLRRSRQCRRQRSQRREIRLVELRRLGARGGSRLQRQHRGRSGLRRVLRYVVGDRLRLRARRARSLAGR